MRLPLKVGERRRNQRGSAMIEGGLTLVVFVSFFLGVLDIGQVMFRHQSIVERVRYAARTAAVACCDADSIKNVILYGSTTAPVTTTTGYWGLTADNITVTFSDQSTANQRVNVRVSGFSYQMFTPMLMGSFNGIPVQVSIPLEMP